MRNIMVRARRIDWEYLAIMAITNVIIAGLVVLLSIAAFQIVQGF